MRRLAGALSFLAIIASAAIVMPAASAQEIRVTVTGEVARPGEYILRAGDRLSLLIERAGGYADDAWLRGAGVERRAADPSRIAAVQDLAAAIRREIYIGAGAGDLARKEEFLAAIGKLAPSLRVPVRLAHPRLLKGTPDDLALEDGDTLTVPRKPATVTVTGAVGSPGTAAAHDPKSGDPAAYAAKAGGFAQDADRNRAYILKPDGKAVPLSRGILRWNAKAARWEIPALVDPAQRIDPGDTIVIPRTARAAWARKSQNLPRLLMELHAATGALVDPP